MTQISPSATAPAFTAQGLKTSLRVIASDTAVGAALGRYAVQTMKARRFAVLDDRSAYGRGLAEAFAKAVAAAGGSVVETLSTSETATDFGAVLAALKAAQPDVLFFGGVSTATSLRRVSPWPGVVVEDGDFAPADRGVGLVLAEPATGGPTHAVSREATGGTRMPSGSSPMRCRRARRRSRPSTRRCRRPTIRRSKGRSTRSTSRSTATGSTPRPPARPSSRRASSKGDAGSRHCPWQPLYLPLWTTMRQSSVTADEAGQVAGPACPAGQACPGFAADAPQIRFGFVSGLDIPHGSPAGSVEQGIDNWRVTVWRR